VVQIVLADETRPVACVMPLQGPRPLPSLTFTMRLSSSDYPFWCLSREVFTITMLVSFISLKQSTSLGSGRPETKHLRLEPHTVAWRWPMSGPHLLCRS